MLYVDRKLVGPVGFEPTTFGLKVRCSAELSYRPTHIDDSNPARRHHSPNLSSSSAKTDAVTAIFKRPIDVSRDNPDWARCGNA